MENNVVSLPARQPIPPVAGNTALAIVPDPVCGCDRPYPSATCKPMHAVEHYNHGWPDWPVRDPSANFNALAALRDAAAEAEAEAAPELPIVHGIGSAIVDRAALAKALAAIDKVIERRNTIPILANVRLQATPGGTLRLAGTDLDMLAYTEIESVSEGALDVTVSCHRLTDIVKRAKASDTVTIEYTGDDNHYAVHFGFAGLSITLQGLPATDFPDLSAGDLSHRFDLPTALFRKGLGKVSIAISTEETRYYLNGVYFYRHLGGYNHADELRLVATDGHRLVYYAIPYVDGAFGMPSGIIPRRAVAEILRNMKAKGAPESVTVEMSATKVRVTIGGLVILSKLIDGTFPDYERVIPRANEKILTVNTAELSAGVEQVGVIHSDRGRACKFYMENGKLSLSVKDSDSGSAAMEMACGYESEPLEIGFNGTYMRDMLALIDGEEVEIRFGDAGSPALFSDTADSSFTGVLMPMRV